MTHTERILQWLTQAGPEGVCGMEMARSISPRAAARINQLRDTYQIETRNPCPTCGARHANYRIICPQPDCDRPTPAGVRDRCDRHDTPTGEALQRMRSVRRFYTGTEAAVESTFGADARLVQFGGHHPGGNGWLESAVVIIRRQDHPLPGRPYMVTLATCDRGSYSFGHSTYDLNLADAIEVFDRRVRRQP